MSVTSAQSPAGEDFDSILSFESGTVQDIPAGWSGGPRESLGVDTSVFHGGVASGRITRTADSANEFSSLTQTLPADVQGTRLTYKAWVRSENVEGNFGLWIRQDGRAGVLDFVDNYDVGLSGDNEWIEVSVLATLLPGTRQIFFGVALSGSGDVWVDDVQLLIDGTPYAEVPKVSQGVPPWETDTEFDAGSGIADLQLTEAQTEDVATLIEVWGFVKYHHPLVAAGDVHIDFELFRALPGVLAAETAATRNAALLEWIRNLGPVDPCTSCTAAAQDTHLAAPVDWVRDTDRLGEELSAALLTIYRNRQNDARHAFVTHTPGIGNAIFEEELPYTSLRTIDAGFRLLALARLWNIVQYWFPYRDLIVPPWQEVLRVAVPEFAGPLDEAGYADTLIRVIARIGDTHADLWGAPQARPPAGSCVLNADFRFVEDRAVVWELHGSRSPALTIGDVLLELDGIDIPTLVNNWRPYYGASNTRTQMRDIARALSIGPCKEAHLKVRRLVDGEQQDVDVRTFRAESRERYPVGRHDHDRPGRTYQALSDDVGYVKLSSIESGDAAYFLRRMSGKAGLVIDIRNDPNAFVVFELGQRLVTEAKPFARFTTPVPDNPGAFTWTEPGILTPQAPSFDGKVAILVDEASLSQAEFAAMAFRAAPDAVVVGSTTAGADGNVSAVLLPGGLHMTMSGIGVFYPDKSPTQRIGILPDIEAKPTIGGIRDGRDEVLEAALRHLLGPDVPAEEIEAMAMRRKLAAK